MIACGESAGRFSFALRVPSLSFSIELTAPLAYGGTDVDLITGTETSPHITQSETYTTANPDNPNQIVVTYNDSRTASANYLWRIVLHGRRHHLHPPHPSPFGQWPRAQTLATRLLSTTSLPALSLRVFLATGCGGQGIGAWKSTDGRRTWTVGPFAFTPARSDDRESGWADNNPSSPFFGRMYVSYNNFADGGSLRVRYSTDNGATWTNEKTLAPALHPRHPDHR